MNIIRVVKAILKSASSQAKQEASGLTPRQRRVVAALRSANGWLSREAIDRIAGASNGPHVIGQLRRKVTGFDGIEMRRVDVVDRDGKRCKPGEYRLTPIGRERLADKGL